MTAAHIWLGGVFNPDTFVAWICHRARLLDLTGSVQVQGIADVHILVQGPQPLIDAMEMACSLGPLDASVDRIEVRETQINHRLNGFQAL